MKKIFLISLLCFACGTINAQNELAPETLWKLGRVSEPRISPDGKMVIYSVKTYDVAENKGQSDIYIVPVDGGDARNLVSSPADESQARWRADRKKIGFLTADKDGSTQLFEVNADGTNKTQVTSVKGGINNFGYAQTMDNVWYTTDIKLDQKPSEIYLDLPKTSEARVIDGLMYRHWNAWHDYAFSHLFLASYTDGKVGTVKDLMTNEKFDTPLQPFGGDEQITFSPDGKKLAYTCKKESGTANAVSTNSDIYVYDLTTGKTTNVTQGMNGYDNNPVYSPDGKKMLWLSMETPGYESDRNRLFIMDVATGEKKELLTNFDYSVDQMDWSSDSKMIYFLSGWRGTHQLFSYDTQAKAPAAPKQITNEQADYQDLTLTYVSNKPVLIASRMSMVMPTEIYKVNANNGTATQRTFTNKTIWDAIAKPRCEKRMVKTSDGKDMLVWVIYPPDFDATKKYPTLLFCQGGPQSIVSQAFSYRWNFSLMASKGYIVVAPNRRGLPSFGEEWNDKITGDWGGQAMIDLLSAIDDVSKESYVDKNKLGCVGASYGGYSVYWLAGHHNKRFKAFIAHDGVFNLESEFGSTEEMFFAHHDMEGPYWKSPKPKSYDAFSPHKFVQNWDTPILIISNEKDYRVPVTQGMEAFTAAQMRGIPSRFLYFPDEGHWVLKPQNSILWQRVFFDWLDIYVK